VKQVSRTSGISSGFRPLFIFSAILALTSFALAGSGQLTSNPSAVNFGSVQLGSSRTQSITLTNAGSSRLIITQATPSVAGFTLTGMSYPVTLYGGQSVSCNITFQPQSAVASSGSVAITFHNRHNTATYSMSEPVSGTGVTTGTLGSSPTSLSFGSVTVGSNHSLSEKVTNNGGTSVTISQVGISGTGFSFNGIAAPVTLTSGQSASFTVTFTPTSAGSASGNVTITSSGSNPTLTIPLSGTGVASTGQLTVAPTTLPVGSVVVGNSGKASGSLTASGASVTVTAATSNNSVFSVGGLSLPVTIPAGQSVPFTVTFSPTTAGAVTATLTFTSNAQPSTTTETLTGTGTAAPTHSVNLSWSGSTSSGISGYNVYRAVYVSSCGSFSKINSLLNTGTLYTDTAVADGTWYCYAITAVNSSKEESGYSNIVSNVEIPAP
jgi:hypothetical protein